VRSEGFETPYLPVESARGIMAGDRVFGSCSSHEKERAVLRHPGTPAFEAVIVSSSPQTDSHFMMFAVFRHQTEGAGMEGSCREMRAGGRRHSRDCLA